MINLLFETNKNYFSIVINNKIITGIIKGISLPYLPSDLKTVQRKIQDSRNKIRADLINVFTITKEEQLEFDNAKDEKELMEIVIKDAKKNRCRLIDTKIN